MTTEEFLGKGPGKPGGWAGFGAQPNYGTEAMQEADSRADPLSGYSRGDAQKPAKWIEKGGK